MTLTAQRVCIHLTLAPQNCDVTAAFTHTTAVTNMTFSCFCRSHRLDTTDYIASRWRNSAQKKQMDPSCSGKHKYRFQKSVARTSLVNKVYHSLHSEVTQNTLSTKSSVVFIRNFTCGIFLPSCDNIHQTERGLKMHQVLVVTFCEHCCHAAELIRVDF